MGDIVFFATAEPAIAVQQSADGHPRPWRDRLR
jgi:hypothetical protein